MNSAYIIDGDNHIHAEGKSIKSVKFMFDIGVVAACCIVGNLTRFYCSDQCKMQIVLDGKIMFDNTRD